jgi:hypothetical protein
MSMRKVLPICFMFVLASCGGRGNKEVAARGAVQSNPEPRPRQELFQQDASSPIIISDGSTHFEHTAGGNFVVLTANKKHADDVISGLAPKSIGYQCGYGTTACTAGPCMKSGPAPGCYVDVSSTSGVTSWTLSLCENKNCSTHSIDFAWTQKTPGKFTADSKDGADLNASPASTAQGSQLNHSKGNQHLQSAALTTITSRGSTDYAFTCVPTSGKTCVTVHF